jgi:putative peptidoglycan lipid II flippase
VGLWLYAEPLVALQFPHFTPEIQAQTVRLTRIVLPAQIFFVTGGILRAVLMAHGRFREQAAAPLLYNASIIAGGLIGGGVEGFAWGVLVGAIAGNWLLPLLGLLRVRPVRVRLAFFDADLARYLWIAAPLMLGVSLTTVDEWYEKYLGAALATGSIAYLGFARKLFMLPVGVIGQALGAAALPILSRLFADGSRHQLEAVLERTLRVSLGLGVLAGAALLAMAEPIVALLYEHGRFDATSSQSVAGLLALMAWATPAWVVQQVAVRAFYAREDTWRPMLLGTAIAVGAIPLYLLLRESRGVEGLALAGVAAMTVNALATLCWARLRHGAPRLSALADAAWRALLIALPSAFAARYALPGLGGTLGAAIDLAAGGAAFAAVAGAGLFVCGDPALRGLFGSLLSRGRGTERAA